MQGASRLLTVPTILALALFGRPPAATAQTASPATAAPAPSPSPSASPSLAPSPAATPPAPSGSLSLTRSAVSVAPGQIIAIGVNGASGTVTVTASSPVVGVRFDAPSSSLVVTGATFGNATVTVRDEAGGVANLAVAVLAPAGTVPAEVTVSLGGTVSPQFALSQITAAIGRLAHVLPGGTLSVRGVTIANALHPGDEVEAIAQVAISAGGAFADQQGATAVHLRVETLAELEPAFLFYSDDPERLGADGDGLLYRGLISVDKPARVYAYHVSDTPDRRLFLTLAAYREPARVQLLGYAAGPSDAFSYVGHVSTLQYMLERSTQESDIVDVSQGAPYVLELGNHAFSPGELVAAIYDMRVLSGGAVAVGIIAASGTTDPLSHIDDVEHAGDGHGRRGEFALASVAPFALSYTAGGPEPAPFVAGEPTIQNLRPGGRPLGGDYGALRQVALELSNPGDAPQDVYLYEQAEGGTATTTIWFAGDPRPTEIPCVRSTTNRYLVKAFALAPGERRTVTGEYMTDGTSSFPLAFGLTSAAPSPPPGPYSPDACNPRTPPPSPAPSQVPAGQTPSAAPSASP